MNNQLDQILSEFFGALAIAVWSTLVFCLAFAVFRRNWFSAKRVIMYLINSGVFLIADIFYFNIAVIVKPPVTGINEADGLNNLSNWVRNYTLENLIITAAIIFLLFGINFLFYKNLNKKKYKTDFFVLLFFDLFVLLAGVYFAAESGFGLRGEERMFFHHVVR